MSLKQQIFNDIVRMRKVVRKSRVHVIHKLTKDIKQLRARKGTPEQQEKFKKKADRLAEEILCLKKLKDDVISKYVLTETKKANEILSNINYTNNDRALAKMLAHKNLETHVKSMQEKYPEIGKYLEKQPQKRDKKKKKIKSPKVENGKKINKKVKIVKEDNWEVSDVEINDNEVLPDPVMANVNGSKTKPNNPVPQKNKSKTEDSDQNTSEKSISKPKLEVSDVEISDIETSPNLVMENVEEAKTKTNTPVTKKDKPKKVKSKTKHTSEKSTISKVKSIKPKLAEVKPLLEVIQTKSDRDHIEPEIETPIKKSQVDSFFLTEKDDFLNIAIENENDSSLREPVKNKVYTDNLNRKQRRTLAKGGKISKPKKNFNNFNTKSNFNNLSFMGADTTKTRPKSTKPVPEIKDEILHPSWQAKKMLKPQIAQFEGKKILFDD